MMSVPVWSHVPSGGGGGGTVESARVRRVSIQRTRSPAGRGGGQRPLFLESEKQAVRILLK